MGITGQSKPVSDIVVVLIASMSGIQLIRISLRPHSERFAFQEGTILSKRYPRTSR